MTAFYKNDIAIDIVRKELSCSAHDMDHVMRVYNTSMVIAEDERRRDNPLD